MKMALLAIALTSFASGQTEAALQSYFENKPVVLKLDLPHELRPKRRDKPAISYSYQSAVPFHQGDRAKITAVRVKSRDVVMELDGQAIFHIADPSFKKNPPSPEQVMTALSQFLDFGKGDIAEPAGKKRTSLARGLTLGQVMEIYGVPITSYEHTEGERVLVTDTFRTPTETIEVDFVRDRVVDFRTRPR